MLRDVRRDRHPERDVRLRRRQVTDLVAAGVEPRARVHVPAGAPHAERARAVGDQRVERRSRGSRGGSRGRPRWWRSAAPSEASEEGGGLEASSITPVVERPVLRDDRDDVPGDEVWLRVREEELEPEPAWSPRFRTGPRACVSERASVGAEGHAETAHQDEAARPTWERSAGRGLELRELVP